jgi:hypothetical protein
MRYILIDGNNKRFAFEAKNDRAAKGRARRYLGRVHSTYKLSEYWQSMRPVGAWNLRQSYGCETAALYQNND